MQKESKLSQKDIEDLKNFPQLPEGLGEEDLPHQKQILNANFPYGCSQLCGDFQFRDTDYIENLNYQQEVNACLTIKYGIAYANKNELKKIKDLTEKRDRVILRINAKVFSSLKTFALGEVTAVYPDRTFRFWYSNQNQYPVGIILLNIIAVGLTRINQQKVDARIIESIYQSLKQTQIPWQNFYTADEEEWKNRRKYITAIEKDEIKSLEKKLIDKNREFLQQFKGEFND